MAKPGVGDRSAWKDRLTDRPWVDGTPWVQADAEEAVDSDVEFLEAEPSAYRLSETPRKQSRHSFNTPLTRLLAYGGIAVVLIAVAIMSRPGDQDPFEQLSTADQQRLLQRQADEAALAEEGGQEAEDSNGEAGGDIGSDESEDSEAPVEPLVSDTDTDASGALAPIPSLVDDLPADLPDLILGFGSDQSVFTIRRSVSDPEEIALVAEDTGGPTGLVEVGASNVIAFANEMSHIIAADGSVSRRPLTAGRLLPSNEGLMVAIIADRTRQAFVVGLPEDGQPAPDADAIVVSTDLDLLGAWNDDALVAKTGKIWLLNAAGEASLVSDGELIGYDGRQLSMLRCDAPQSCRIEVGPPNEPGLVSVALPTALAVVPVEEWAPRAVVSPDGSRLAINDGRSDDSRPAIIDLSTGEIRTQAGPVDADSPIAWSPDGRYVVYAASGEIVIWDTEADETWNQPIGRDISYLAWIVDTETG